MKQFEEFFLEIFFLSCCYCISGIECFLVGENGFFSSRPTHLSLLTQREEDLVITPFLRWIVTQLFVKIAGIGCDDDHGDGHDAGGDDDHGEDIAQVPLASVERVELEERRGRLTLLIVSR